MHRIDLSLFSMKKFNAERCLLLSYRILINEKRSGSHINLLSHRVTRSSNITSYAHLNRLAYEREA
jgi:hypothetical protein